ncbi:MAG: BREX system P-loop protein BrxC [Deltaproteobacteria bacterium]|nr:BREX system P-loop protein BrxC [Deltaproteobacteria bacterium]
METIRTLFAKPIERKIEEVIKVDQANEQTVLSELEEYIVTDSIKDHFRLVYDEIIAVSKSPREGIGVWVSGFFGSGKSSFAKILGYTVAAIPVSGRPASEIFKENVKDARIRGLIDVINRTLPIHAVIFDVSMDRGIRTASERITEIMYKALLRELDYAEDFDLADLEITLEGDGKLDEFCQRFEKMHNKPWRVRRKVGTGINEASAVLHAMDSMTYSSADSWAKSLGEKGRADITPNTLAERAFELASRRKPGKSLIFIIDEVGQYVSRSVEKMLDLQAVVQAFGKEGKNRVEAKKATSPFWIVVTSQEKLNEIVDALDSKKIELARLQDRFRIPIDLKQTDIPEITGKRVLDKKQEAKAWLKTLYDANEGRLKTLCAMERTSRDVSVSKENFVNLYPYLPYQIDLCIDIVAGLRLKRGAHRHIGGSNRTIIKQAQEMMINPSTMLADAPIGTLVTLDKVYELLYLGNLLPTETTREVDAIPKLLPGNDMALKVAKAISLLESVKDLPRTAHNISVVLHPSVESDSIKKDVESAIKALKKAQVIKDSDEGYKLLTVQEKKWDTTRKGLEPKPAERNRIMRQLLKEIFADPKIKSYRYKNLRGFKMVLSIEGETVDADGQVPLNVLVAEDQADVATRTKEARESSTAKQDEAFWVMQLDEETHQLFYELFRSREMVSTHERLAAQGSLTPEEASCLAEEKVRGDKNHRTLRTKLGDAIQSGSGFFRGVQHDGSSLGQSLPEVFARLLDLIIPDLYPKLEMGIRPLKSDDSDKFLTAANLNGLTPVFYDGEAGLSLVTNQGGKYLPNLSSNICKEVLSYLVREHKYGNKVTGKMLENHFQGLGYGWDRDVIQLVLAVLLRGGAVEVTYQGRKYRNHTDPACRVPFSKVPAFRAASFAPREPIDLRTLADAARNYEEITGKEVDIEESAIAAAFKKMASEDKEQLLPLVARMKALNLPGTEFMENHLQTVEGILDMPPDDCVKTLAGEGKSYKNARSRALRLEEATSEANLKIIRKAKNVLENLWPVLRTKDPDEKAQEKASELATLLEAEDFYDSLEAMKQAADHISGLYSDLYERTHKEREILYAKALETIKGLPEWVAISQDPSITQSEREAVLKPLTQRAALELELLEGASVCRVCRATVGQMETDIAATEAFRDQAIKKIQEMAAPGEKIERVRVSTIFTGKLETEGDIDAALSKLKDHLLKLLSSGIKIILE